MSDLLPALVELAWPGAIALAWVLGELVHRWTGAPRISVYGLVGFALGHAQLGLLPPAGGGALLANVAFGLILFEFGYRINLRWLRTNPWLTATGLRRLPPGGDTSGPAEPDPRCPLGGARFMCRGWRYRPLR